MPAGCFLLYKATSEIHHKLEGDDPDELEGGITKGKVTITNVVTQIAITNIVFSIDSILTAIGLTQNVTIMMIAVILSILIMMFFAGPVGRFVNEHPTVQMLGLAFLIMIGFMLVAEGAHLSEVVIFNQEVGTVPKGYLYFAIAFSLLVEFLNIRLRRKRTRSNSAATRVGRSATACYLIPLPDLSLTEQLNDILHQPGRLWAGDLAIGLFLPAAVVEVVLVRLVALPKRGWR